MAADMRDKQENPAGVEATRPAEAPPVYFEARTELAQRFLFGDGIEIGPLHLPLAMPPQARVRYVDRMDVEGLRSEYPELADWELTRVDLIDDGEALQGIPDSSQDFIVANHFLEHTEDPIGTILLHLRKLKPGGILFYAIPDKRYTFDFRRSPTPIEHVVSDHENGPGHSRRGHYEEWARLVVSESDQKQAPSTEAGSQAWVRQRAAELEEASYSIHMHVWTQAEFLQMILHCRERTGETFEIEVAAKREFEFVVVLRKQGDAAPAPAPVAVAGHDIRELRKENERLQRHLRDVTGSLSWRLTRPVRAAKQRGSRLLRGRG